MPALLPFRPWSFADGECSRVSAIKDPERRSDDRSPFVRYARAAAQWAEWVRDGVVVQSDEAVTPVEGDFQLGILPIDAIKPTMTLPPSAKEHSLRLLEGVQMYPDPVVVVEMPDGSFRVVANHELFDAARAYQQDMARPGRVRSSDHCLVAVAPTRYLDSMQTVDRAFSTSKSDDEIAEALTSEGYALSPRPDDPSNFIVHVGSSRYIAPADLPNEWQAKLAHSLGIRSLDLGSNVPQNLANEVEQKIVLTSPGVTVGILQKSTEYPFGSLMTDLVPPSGAMMWSLRDFSN